LRKKTLLSWSSGKDSAWALHVLLRDPAFDVRGLFALVSDEEDRVSMHGVRTEVLRSQAGSCGLPLRLIRIPDPCPNEEYASVMRRFVDWSLHDGIRCMAFGDLSLEDVRAYREDRLRDTGIAPAFPLWDRRTDELVREMQASGLRAVITSVDPQRLPRCFIGREWSAGLLAELPADVDPCGENGEFHTVVVAGPMFRRDIKVTLGEIIEQDHVVFADVLLARGSASQSALPGG
jgi:uncharacterized protein (TIGR00290 family)